MYSAVKKASHELDLSIGPSTASLIEANNKSNIKNGGYFLFYTIGSILILLSKTIGATYTNTGTLLDITGATVTEAVYSYEGFNGVDELNLQGCVKSLRNIRKNQAVGNLAQLVKIIQGGSNSKTGQLIQIQEI